MYARKLCFSDSFISTSKCVSFDFGRLILSAFRWLKTGVFGMTIRPGPTAMNLSLLVAGIFNLFSTKLEIFRGWLWCVNRVSLTLDLINSLAAIGSCAAWLPSRWTQESTIASAAARTKSPCLETVSPGLCEGRSWRFSGSSAVSLNKNLWLSEEFLTASRK